MISYLVLIPIGYALGSLPFGLIVGWIVKGADVRDFGSGRTGFTNVLRTVGVPAAVLVLALDMGKGALAVVLARVLADSHGVEVAAALAALAGHNWPAFLGFKGGRGVASGLGALVILSPLSGLVAAAVGLPVAAGTRFVSLGSILGTLSGTGVLIGLVASGHAPSEYLWFAGIAGPTVIAQHRENIARLLRGEELRLGQSAEAVRRPAKVERRRGLPWSRSA